MPAHEGQQQLSQPNAGFAFVASDSTKPVQRYIGSSPLWHCYRCKVARGGRVECRWPILILHPDETNFPEVDRNRGRIYVRPACIGCSSKKVRCSTEPSTSASNISGEMVGLRPVLSLFEENGRTESGEWAEDIAPLATNKRKRTPDAAIPLKALKPTSTFDPATYRPTVSSPIDTVASTSQDAPPLVVPHLTLPVRSTVAPPRLVTSPRAPHPSPVAATSLPHSPPAKTTQIQASASTLKADLDRHHSRMCGLVDSITAAQQACESVTADLSGRERVSTGTDHEAMWDATDFRKWALDARAHATALRKRNGELESEIEFHRNRAKEASARFEEWDGRLRRET